MKTLNISKVVLDNVAYYCFTEPERWIDLQSGVFLHFEGSSSTFVVRRDGDVFEVDVLPFRNRDWIILFRSFSARAVLQSLYDFLYV